MSETPKQEPAAESPRDLPDDGGPAHSLRVRITQWFRKHRNVELAILTLVGTVLGVVAGGRGSFSLGPLRAALSIVPSLHSGTMLDLGPLGSIFFRSHRALVDLSVAVTSIDPSTARTVVGNAEVFDKLALQAGEDLRAAVAIIVFKATIGGAAAAAALVFLAFRDSRKVMIAALASLLISVASLGVAFLSYDSSAIRQPRFEGLVAAAPSLIGSVDDITENLDRYRSQMGRLLPNASTLYNLGNALPSYEIDPDSIAVLHISDMHLNPQGWDLVKQLIRQYNVDLVADTGDITDHGTALEDSYLDPIGELGVPYLYVRGNHDSEHTEGVIRGFSNAVVLDDGDSVLVSGLRFAGVGDLAFTPDKSIPTVTPAARAASVELLADGLRATDVSIALLHDPSGVERLDGLVPTVLAGHRHHRRITELPGGTTVMVQGSTGGSGLRALTDGKADPLQATILHVDKRTGKVTAWDDVSMGGIGLASAQISRHLAQVPKR